MTKRESKKAKRCIDNAIAVYDVLRKDCEKDDSLMVMDIRLVREEAARKLKRIERLKNALDKVGNILLYMKEAGGDAQTARYSQEALDIIHNAIAEEDSNG